MQRTEITIAHISLPHTHLCIVLWVHNPLEAHGDKGVCTLCDPIYTQGRSFLQQCSERCGNKVPVVPWRYWNAALAGEEPAAPELFPACASGSVIQLFFVLLSILVWFLQQQKLYATKRHLRALHRSLPFPPASCWTPRTQLTAQNLLQPDAQNWFLHPVSAVNGCPCSSSTAGDNAAPWITFTV